MSPLRARFIRRFQTQHLKPAAHDVQLLWETTAAEFPRWFVSGDRRRLSPQKEGPPFSPRHASMIVEMKTQPFKVPAVNIPMLL